MVTIKVEVGSEAGSAEQLVQKRVAGCAAVALIISITSSRRPPLAPAPESRSRQLINWLNGIVFYILMFT